MIEDNITFFEDGDEILPGIAARASFGHTPGHMCFEVPTGAPAQIRTPTWPQPPAQACSTN